VKNDGHEGLALGWCEIDGRPFLKSFENGNNSLDMQIVW